jgi:hypothetical protein
MMKSARVTLTVVAAIGCARAQQAANPCGPASFNENACRTAVQHRGYCAGGDWVAQQYQPYPYYYDLYRTYSAAGGTVTATVPETCRRTGGHGIFYSGFGAHGHATHGSHGG